MLENKNHDNDIDWDCTKVVEDDVHCMTATELECDSSSVAVVSDERCYV